MAERSKDWLNQAKRDFEAAKKQEEHGFYEWACFIYQQAAEKAIKGVYQKLGGEAWGHSINELLKGIKEKVKIDEDLIEKGKTLDKFYIPARYPIIWLAGPK